MSERVDRRLRPILAKLGVAMKSVRAARNLFATFVHVDKWRERGEEVYRRELRGLVTQLADLLPKNEKLELLQVKELQLLCDNLPQSPLLTAARARLAERSEKVSAVPD
jgi:hypothetical protein